MGFPQRIRAWVGLLYTNIVSKFVINGHLTKAVKVNCGVRQGCPLSAILYVLCIEPLAQILRRDKRIKGLTIPGSGGQQAKCILYMDDFSILCTDILSVNRILDLTDWFGQASGSRLNRDKTNIKLYGPWTQTETNDLPPTQENTNHKILGVQYDKYGQGDLNWTDIIGRARQKLGHWTQRRLTMEGKILIIKALILPMMLLTATVFIPPRYILLKLDRAIFHFLWGSKWERLKRTDMKKSKRNGGKEVPDIHSFLLSRYTATHLSIATDQNRNPKTKAFAHFLMGSYLRKIQIIPVDLRIPVAFNLPKHYTVIPNFLKLVNAEQKDLKILTNHRSLLSLVQQQEQMCQVRGLTTGKTSQVWDNVNHPALPNKLKDLSWMVAHEILPVRSVMHSRGLLTQYICPRPGCGAPETVRHLLWECSAAVDQWAMATSSAFLSLPAREVLTEQMVLYGVSKENIPKPIFGKLWLTIAAIKDAIWTSRNLLVSRQVQIPPVAVIQMAKSTLDVC